VLKSVYQILGGIALAQAIPHIPTHFFIVWPVCCLSVTFIYPLLKPFDGFKCYSALRGPLK